MEPSPLLLARIDCPAVSSGTGGMRAPPFSGREVSATGRLAGLPLTKLGKGSVGLRPDRCRSRRPLSLPSGTGWLPTTLAQPQATPGVVVPGMEAGSGRMVKRVKPAGRGPAARPMLA